MVTTKVIISQIYFVPMMAILNAHNILHRLYILVTSNSNRVLLDSQELNAASGVSSPHLDPI